MKTLYHADITDLLQKLQEEPEFQCGNNDYRPTGKEWYRERVWLEFPIGELAKNWLTNLALCGGKNPEVLSMDGKERFNAQGIEHKARVEKDLFGALIAMRDILPLWRGRIVGKGETS